MKLMARLAAMDGWITNASFITGTFGKDAALFMLDTRSFRDAVVTPLTPAEYSDPFAVLTFLRKTFAPNRTLLGSAAVAGSGGRLT